MSFCLKIKIILRQHDYVLSHLFYFYCYEKTLQVFLSSCVVLIQQHGCLSSQSNTSWVFVDKWIKNVFLFHCPLVIHWHRATAPSTWTELLGTPFLHVGVEERDFCTLLTYSCCTEFIKAQELCLGCSREQLQPACNLLLCSTLGLRNSLKGPGKNFIDFLGSHSGWLHLGTLMVDV